MTTPTPIRIMFAGGGTGGHFYPALRLAEGARQYAELHAAPEPVIAFFGNPDKIEGKALQDKETFFPLDVQGFHRGSVGTMISKNLAFTGKLLKSYLRARKNIKEFSPDVVVGTGGYVSGPPLFAAAQRGIPTLIQEQNSYPGVTSRMLAKYANEIHVAYEDAIEYLDEKKTVISGNPVKNFFETTDQASAKRALGLPPEKAMILVTGGSQGAEAINKHLAATLSWYAGQDELTLFWQCGEKNIERYAPLAGGEPDIRLVGFIQDMDSAYTAADIIIGRAGALTISELAIVGKPAILIPLPTAAANHQVHNAQSYASDGAARMVEQHQLSDGLLEDTISDILDNPALREEMSKQAREKATPEATRQIVESIYRLAGMEADVSEV